MSLFKKRLKIGRRVATITYSLSECNHEFKTGKIIAIREPEDDNAYDCRTYAVRFDDGKIDLFSARQLFTEWGGRMTRAIVFDSESPDIIELKDMKWQRIA